MNTVCSEDVIPQQINLSYSRLPVSKMIRISSSIDVYHFVRPFFLSNMDTKESMWLVSVNNSNRILGMTLLSIGSLTTTLLPIREVLQIALLSNASGVIICHNHPSGTLVPSDSDVIVTKRLTKALQYIEVELLDHMILSSEGYMSFADDCML